jgi:UTP--glucose-1-phosphate uridylyltransferase
MVTHLPEFVAKMQAQGLPQAVIDTFACYYDQVLAGESGLVYDRDIAPVTSEELADARTLSGYAAAGREAMGQAVRIVLNGGLGTSMGLTGPKSLLPVRDGKSFLEIILSQVERQGQRLALMNSFSTQRETEAALRRLAPKRMPWLFLQHKFPKVQRSDMAPAAWPADPTLEWNPPGHGDVYTALATSGTLARLLAEGVRYAFMSNSDNLGAQMDAALLGYFVHSGCPFMMEVAEKTPTDIKGGHLARARSGRLLLRESAQCPADEICAFEDIERYRFFNTNNIWIDLITLQRLLDQEGIVRLPLILNPKTLDPRDKTSPPVFQIETAMGAAISLFEGASAVRVPRERFFPVKKCSDLLAVRSDLFSFTPQGTLALHPPGRPSPPPIRLDGRYYNLIDDFEARFPAGCPSLAACESLSVEGDVIFAAGVTLRGRVTVRNDSGRPATIPAGSVLEGDVRL